MKVYNFDIVFREFPGEVTLAFNISNCPCHCEGCHSPFLAEDKGDLLTPQYLTNFLNRYPGVTCIGIMGGDADPDEVMQLASMITDVYKNRYKVGWYSGRDHLPDNFDVTLFDYVKIGRYDKQLGGLDSPTTNQRIFKVDRMVDCEKKRITIKSIRCINKKMVNLKTQKESLL